MEAGLRCRARMRGKAGVGRWGGWPWCAQLHLTDDLSADNAFRGGWDLHRRNGDLAGGRRRVDNSGELVADETLWSGGLRAQSAQVKGKAGTKTSFGKVFCFVNPSVVLLDSLLFKQILGKIRRCSKLNCSSH
jgi:hypothetical protein